MRPLALALCVIGAAACTRTLPSSFACTVSSQCVSGGVAGTCEPSGACSFPDDSCASGRRYGDLGPAGVAGTCVDVDFDLGTVIPPSGAPDLAMGPPPPGVITRVGSAKVAPGAPKSGVIILSLPTGLQPGDVLFATAYANDPNSSIAAPAAWTQHATLAGGNYRASWFYKVFAVGDSNVTGFAVTSTPSTVAAAVVAYRGVDPAMLVDAFADKGFTATPYVAPSITTTRANDMLVAMFVDTEQGQLLSAPSGMATAVDDTAIFVFDATQPLPGASGNKTASTFPGVGAVDFVALPPP